MIGLLLHGEIGNLFGPLSWIIWASLGGQPELFDHSLQLFDHLIFDLFDQLSQFRKKTALI